MNKIIKSLLCEMVGHRIIIHENKCYCIRCGICLNLAKVRIVNE